MIGYLLGVELPVRDEANKGLRPAGDVCAMAVAVQANLVQLKIAECKLQGTPTSQHALDGPFQTAEVGTANVDSKSRRRSRAIPPRLGLAAVRLSS